MSLIDYAKTARQREAIKAYEECGEVAVNAAALLGITPSTMRDHVKAVKNYAAQQGYSTNWDARRHVPEGDLTYCKPVFKETINEDVRVF